MNRQHLSTIHATLVATAALCLSVLPLAAETEEAPDGASTKERVDAAKAARGGAGLRVGSWSVSDLPRAEGATSSESPNFEGYFQKGLDRHLVLENTLGFWRWVQEIEQEGGTFSEPSREVVSTYLIPAFSGIKFYPLTEPGSRLEPYAKAGVGFVFGIEDAETSGSGLLGLGGSGTSFKTGFGLNGGLGVDWVFSRAFGLSVGGRYQWLRFTEEVGGQRTFKGLGVDLGLTYRFRY